MPKIIEVKLEGHSLRLDRALFHAIRDQHPDLALSRAQLQNLIEQGNVSINQKVASKSSLTLSGNALVQIAIPEEITSTPELKPWNFALNIVYQDDDIIVIDKPAGLSMHPGAGNRSETLVQALKYHLQKSGAKSELFGDEPPREPPHDPRAEIQPSPKERPGIVHRLDKDTSGLVVAALSSAVLSNLQQQFKSRTIGRQYEALVYTTPRSERPLNKADSGIIKTRFGRDPQHRTRMAVLKEGGREAITHWQVVERFPYALRVLLKLETGRTHQIRVHLAHLHAPVLGDSSYGAKAALSGLSALEGGALFRAVQRLGRQALHARLLEFTHPSSGERMHFESKIPSDMIEMLEALRQYSQDR